MVISKLAMAKIQKSACQRLMCTGVFWVSITSLLIDNHEVEVKNTNVNSWRIECPYMQLRSIRLFNRGERRCLNVGNVGLHSIVHLLSEIGVLP